MEETQREKDIDFIAVVIEKLLRVPEINELYFFQPMNSITTVLLIKKVSCIIEERYGDRVNEQLLYNLLYNFMNQYKLERGKREES